MLGGENLYWFAPSVQAWVDWLGLRFAKSHIIRINGRNPINSSYAGTTYHLSGKLGGKYLRGVQFNMFGLPDYSRYSVKNVNLGKPVGDYQDFKKANILAFVKNNPFGAKDPPEFVWHHDTGGMMRLLAKDIYKSVKHTGSAAQHQTRKGKGKRKGKC